MGEGIVSVAAQTNTPANAAGALQDESIRALNARLHEYVDCTLGFGVVEGSTKQPLVKLAPPPPFTPFQRTATTFQSEENTSSVQGAMGLEQIARLAPTGVDVGVQTRTNMAWKTVREKSVVVCRFTRIIAKRSIVTPIYKKLLPVKRKKHLNASNDWLVELYGNELYTTEYYGGKANISFMWNRQANISISEIVSAIEAIVGDSKAHRSVVQKAQMAELQCTADVKGFKLPGDTRCNLTTVSSIMTLISELNTLPIDCAVPVGTETIPIQSVREFPPTVHVETRIREDQILEKLMGVQLQLEATEPVNIAALNFVADLRHMIAHAATSNRSLIGAWKALGNTVAQTLAPHGKRVELYERYGERRLHTENCDTNGVTASASECLNWFTLGVAMIGTRPHQVSQFHSAPVWTAPEHFKTRQICNTAAVTGYYDRVKVMLVFDNDNQLELWRQQVQQLIMEGRRMAEQLMKTSWLPWAK